MYYVLGIGDTAVRKENNVSGLLERADGAQRL